MKKLPLASPHLEYVEKSFREWLDILGYAPSTVYGLPNYVRELFYYLERQGIGQVAQLEAEHIRTHYGQLKERANQRRGGGLSNAYLNKHLQALYKFSEYLRQSGRRSLPPLKLDWEAGDSEEITVLSQEEIKQLYAATVTENEGSRQEALNARDRAALTVFYGCGLRRNEGYWLDISDINFDRQLLHVRKGKNYKERLVPFGKASAKHLEEYVYDWRPLLAKDKKEEAFFISRHGRRMETQSLALRLKLLQQRTNNTELQEKNVRLHVLRHSIATHLLQNGMSLEKISRFLGHSSLESTQVYTHLVENENGERITISQPYRNIPRYDIIRLHEDE